MKHTIVALLAASLAASLLLSGCLSTSNTPGARLREKLLEGALTAAKTPVVLELTGLTPGRTYAIFVFDRFHRSEKGGETGSTKTSLRRPDGSRGTGYEGTHDGVFYSDDPGGISIRALDASIRLSIETSKASGVGTFRILVTEQDETEFAKARLIRGSVDDVPSITKGSPGNKGDERYRYGLFLHGSSIVPEARDLQAEYARGGDHLFVTAEEGRFVELPFAGSTLSLTVDTPARAGTSYATAKALAASSFLFDGGDQSVYYRAWKGSAFANAIGQAVVSRQVPIGGNSAGLAILSPFVYAALHDHDLSAREALADPYNAWMTVEDGVFALPGLENTIIESHYSERGRAGRLMAFLARLLVDGRAKPGELYGIGVDENTCLVIDENGKIRVFGPGSAWILVPLTMPDACKAGLPLSWSGKAVKAVKIAGSAAGFTAADNGYLDWKTVRTLPATSWLSIENGTLMELAGNP